ncbi:hypothetical protein AGABI2DRAFT_206493 [Agaricus bisporus var. bisporus H97]|uniref:hypothetical protein n=1 Tax=Agaricus bisporus var. bisporus (strain H97 / ATCC MYA-4626 / FGSC 10389) TaxID=936046 RepID=UPI00029F6AD2|nr:hypothetical protein AGABI2DRAFT_206493 [Agaricus bisporus var. bisporus H97]EKV46914.1 hypothetical protein AGABI2DRAFT_206493 [Agaricus bisporus var. bisporus H97]
MPGRPDVNLVIVFRAAHKNTHLKQRTRNEARKAEQQYLRLIDTLTYAGLKAVGRRGESLGQLLVFVTCPQKHLEGLIRRERHGDFLSGLPVTPVTADSLIPPLSSAEKIRLVYTYVTSSPTDGGLGIAPGASEWDLVESITPLHDVNFNETWVRSWKLSQIASVKLGGIRDQFGDSVGLYFAFLSSYTQFLAFPAILGLFSYFFLSPYSSVYSILLCIWSVGFVEYWKVRERILSLRFGTRGSFRVEKCRVTYRPGQTWWGRELRIFASLPVILLFAGVLVALLTSIFVFEAFVTQLYQGPGKKLISFSPTLLFAALVPRVLQLYQALAVGLTTWENHRHQSSYNKSLTLKTFALSAIVAYMALGLSAFVYVPFGQSVMRYVQNRLFATSVESGSRSGFGSKIMGLLNGTTVDSTATTTGFTSEKLSNVGALKSSLWDRDMSNARRKLNPTRLRDQMFAYTVTNQVINSFTEVGLPYIMRYVTAFRHRHDKNATKPGSPSGEPKKRVVFEDEKERGGMEERVFLDHVREEVALPEYDLFADYSEMVIQFGYVVLWSTIWPLAGVMAFINNIVELRGDAFKMTVHHRRPIPTRADSIGPWLEALSFLAWLGALTNSALVYLFSPELLKSSPLALNDEDDQKNTETNTATKELVVKAVLVALVASHGYFVLRAVVRHVVERIWWIGSKEVQLNEREERLMKEKFLEGAGAGAGAGTGESNNGSSVRNDLGEENVKVSGVEVEDTMGFWDHDEGVDEIKRLVKEA